MLIKLFTSDFLVYMFITFQAPFTRSDRSGPPEKQTGEADVSGYVSLKCRQNTDNNNDTLVTNVGCKLAIMTIWGQHNGNCGYMQAAH